jgi:hypothetical protein
MMPADPAVSSIISEMLLIALVLILVPAVTISLMNQLPEDRVPTVSIKMSSLDDTMVTLYHKGGDWIKKSEIKILLNEKQRDFESDNPIFDLGNSISLTGVAEGDEIYVVAKNAVVFRGEVHS